MERLKRIKDCLISAIETHLDDLDAVDTKEMGEVIDMIKDIEEAIYYYTVTHAMLESGETKAHHIPTPTK